ncbi:MAG TPA: DUF885 domain-containing protein, partial [Sphingomonas sp.]|nr:DUF885 domain-containing protein [Sphingomonas sp.]
MIFEPSRRALLQSAAVGGAIALLPGTVFAEAARPALDTPLGPLLQTFADEILVLSPETATSLGLDSGA